MKKIIILFSILLITFGATSQTFTPIHNYQAPDGLAIIKYLGLPYGTDTTSALAPDSIYISGPGGSYKKSPALFFQTSDNILYIHTDHWVPLGSVSGKDTVNTEYPIQAKFDASGRQTIYLAMADGFLIKGTVTHIHDTVFYATGSTYVINGQLYNSSPDSITLTGIDPDDPMKFIFVVDTLSRTTFVAGEPAAIPLDPDLDAGQLQLTSGITFGAGATEPTGIVTDVVYDENIEWTVGSQGPTMTKDANNTDNPYHGSKAIFISKYLSAGEIYFTDAEVNTYDSNAVLTMAFYSVGNFENNMRLRFYNPATGITNSVLITNAFGLTKTLGNQYQILTIPLSTFQWTNGGLYKTLLLQFVGSDTSGAKGVYLDYIRIQKGIPNIPLADNYPDSAGTYRIDSTHYITKTWRKGIPTNVGDTIVSGSSSGGGGTVTSVGTGYGLSGGTITTTGTIEVDTSLLLTKLRANSLYLQNITGLVSQGSNVTVTGAGTAVSPYVINSTAGGSGTVTSISQGYGIVATPNPITSTGTIVVDSAALSLKYLRIADSTTAYTTPYKSSLKQDALVSGGNIKTVNGNSLLGSGNVSISGSGISKAYAPLIISSGGDSISQRYNVLTYGADNTGNSNSTTAIQAAINACDAGGGGTVYFPKGTYLLSDTVVTRYNAQLYIPVHGYSSSARTHIYLVGEGGPNFVPVGLAYGPSAGMPVAASTVILKSIVTTGSAGSAVIGTAKFDSSGAIPYNETFLSLDNIAIQVKNNPSGTGPVIGGVSYKNGASLQCKNVVVYIDTSVYRSTLPANDVTGIESPDISAETQTTFENTVVIGFRSGYKMSEHTLLNHADAFGCYYGFYAKNAGHDIGSLKALSQYCVYDLYIAGVCTLADFNLNSEWIGGDGKWYDNINTIKDSANLGLGEVFYSVTEFGVGSNHNVRYSKSGGSNIHASSHEGGYAWNYDGGNQGISNTDTTFYLGTTNSTPLRFKTKSVTAVVIDTLQNTNFNNHAFGFINNAYTGASPTNALQPNTLALYSVGSSQYKIGLDLLGSMWFQIAGAQSFKFYQGTTLMPSSINSAGNFSVASNGRYILDAATSPADPTNTNQNGTFSYVESTTNPFKNGIAASRASKFDIYWQTGATSGGGYRWYQGTTELASISQAGNLLIGTTTDDPYAIFNPTSTTKGMFLPRQTLTQRNTTLTGVSAGTLVGGSGYTNGTYTNSPLTSVTGTGSGATGTFTVTAGVVGPVTLVTKGSGYKVGDILSSSSIGGGTGFTITITSLTGSRGNMLYNVTDSSIDITDGAGNISQFGNKIVVPQTIITAGTTGNQTINKISGSVNIAASGTSITVTNSEVSATSEVFAICATNDATAYVKNVVCSAGSFVITLGAAATAETKINFFVINK
jgi:hypothetical protein